MTSDVTLTGALTKAQNTQQQGINLAEDFNEFLNLLTTQLQNQDPLNPMDSNEFTNQIVQFSQVEQAINTNQKLDSLLSLQLASISSVALGYVGLDISYRSIELNYDGENPVRVNYALSEDSSEANIIIADENGQTVYKGPVPTGTGGHEFVWNGENNGGGTVDPGTYSVRVDAKSSSTEEFIDVTTVVSGNVRGIESQNGVIFLLIGDRAIALSNVINASLPVTAEETAADTATEDTTTNDETQV